MKKKEEKYEHHVQPFAPVFDRKSKVLILGSFPSVESRKNNFYYGHPQNRFWKVLSIIFKEDKPETISQKQDFLLRNHIAVYDVIESCDIIGSSDSSIKNVVAADINHIIENSSIDRIFVNGGLAKRLYDKYILPSIKIEAIRLPSTSPANARFTLEKLVNEWIILEK